MKQYALFDITKEKGNTHFIVYGKTVKSGKEGQLIFLILFFALAVQKKKMKRIFNHLVSVYEA